jgi:RNA polymerase sigma-70 factor (ECF subfamily)
MATNEPSSSHRDAVHQALPRLYKFALILTANEELARALLRGTVKALNTRNEWRDEDRERLTAPFRRMFTLWAAKMAEDPAVQRRCQPEPRLFATAFINGPLTGGAQLAKFLAGLPPQERGVLYLVYGERAPYDEAADIAGLNMLALMKLLARGHLALAQWLDQRGLGEDGTRFPFDPFNGHERAA